MRIILPARRSFITAAIIFFSLYVGYNYLAITAGLMYILAWFIFPVRHPQDFFSSVVPAMDAMTKYLRNIIHAVNQPTANYDEKELLVSFYLPKQGYAEWVFHSGFNPALRAGYRNFLLQLEHAADTCVALGYWKFALKDMNTRFADILVKAIQVNVELLAALSRTMRHHADKTPRPANDATLDFVNDIVSLEAVLSELVPGNVELLDLSPDYIAMTNMVRNVKDLRGILLELAAAVPQ